MLFIRPKRSTSPEDSVIKKTFTMHFLMVSFLAGQNLVQVKLKNGTTIDGEFIGTYMEHIHLLKGENINYYKCDDIQIVIKSGYVDVFEYDCSKNTVTADILFPPQLNPMTGEWETDIPNVFKSKKRKILAQEEKRLAKLEKSASKDKKTLESLKEKPGFGTGKTLQDRLEKAKNNLQKKFKISTEPVVSKKQLEKTKKTFQEIITPSIKTAKSDGFYKDSKEKNHRNKTETNEKVLSSSSPTNIVSNPQKEIKEEITTYYYENGAKGLSKDEIRMLIKKEVRKELRKSLPLEIKKHKEQKQNQLFQNLLFGCGSCFFFMILLSF